MDHDALENFLRQIGHGDHGLRLILADWLSDQTGDEALCGLIRAAPDCEKVLRLFPVARPTPKDAGLEWSGQCKLWAQFRTLAVVSTAGPPLALEPYEVGHAYPPPPGIAIIHDRIRLVGERGEPAGFVARPGAPLYLQGRAGSLSIPITFSLRARPLAQ